MSVDKVAGLVLVHQAVESVKAGVTGVVPVVEVQGGGVGQQDVKALAAHQLPAPAQYPPVHLPLGILVFPIRLVPGRAPQTENPDTLVGVYPVFHADAALRRRDGVAVVVIAVDVQQGGAGKGHDERKILWL